MQQKLSFIHFSQKSLSHPCPQSKISFLIFRLHLPDEDYHEFVVKNEKKNQAYQKRKFTFTKNLYDPDDPSTNMYWHKDMEMIPSKKIPEILKSAPLPLE